VNKPSSNESRAAAESAKSPAATWVRAKRAPRRKRVDGANALQLGAITLASNCHA
jgi:hypothetical protein